MAKLRPEEHKKKATEYAKKGRLRTPEGQREYDLIRHFGITTKDYDDLLKKQKGVCCICGNPETIVDNRTKQIRRLAVDHCHKTNKVRGLLCMGCNQGLGNFRDNPDYLARAISYLINNGP